MLQVCTFDETKDIGLVVPNLSITLDVNLNNLVIKDTGVLSDDNGIDNVAHIVGRIGDNFDAINAQRQYFANSNE